MKTYLWLLPVPALALMVSGCVTAPDYDAQAKESLGRVTAKRVAGTFDRRTPSIGGQGAGAAVAGYVGWALAQGFYSTKTNVTVYEYTVALQDGRAVNVFREWGNHAVGDCVRVFESSSERRDYPRLIDDTGCDR